MTLLVMLALLLAGPAVPAPAPASRPAGGAPELSALPPADGGPLTPLEGVRDPAFATLMAFNNSRVRGRLDGPEFTRIVELTGRKTRLPYRWILWEGRMPFTADSTTLVEVVFDRKLDLPLPYKIIAYHPGSIRAPGRLLFREYALGTREIVWREGRGGGSTTWKRSIQNARLYILEEGSLDIDIDGWLDALAGDDLDDTRIVALATWQKEGHWYSTALGYNKSGGARSGTLDMAADEILYPGPEEFRAVARHFRRLIEIYAPSIRPARRP